MRKIVLISLLSAAAIGSLLSLGSGFIMSLVFVGAIIDSFQGRKWGVRLATVIFVVFNIVNLSIVYPEIQQLLDPNSLIGFRFYVSAAVFILAAISLVISEGQSQVAEKDPGVYAATRSGHVGFRWDGYLGIVITNPPKELLDLVAKTNNNWKSESEKIAAKNRKELAEIETMVGKRQMEKAEVGTFVMYSEGNWEMKES